MRADGSIKSVTTGVSTVDKAEHGDRQYMKACLNFRNDQQDGLRRRPPAQLTDSLLEYTDKFGVPRKLDNFDIDKDLFKAVTVDGERYWFYNRTDGIGELTVFNDQGTPENVNLISQSTYLSTIAGNDDVELVVSGSTAFVVNKKQIVQKIAGSTPVYENHSMLVVRQAPKVFSTIVVKWENPDYTQSTITYEIGEDHPAQPVPDVDDVDNGVNTIAGLVAAKIRAQILAEGNDSDLEIDDEGATIVFRNVADGREFSKVTVEDGTGGAFLAINGTVESLDQLPRNANPGALLTVRPNAQTNRGEFFMRARAVLEAEAPNPLPAELFTLTPEIGSEPTRTTSGFSTIFGPFGAMAPTEVLTGFPNQTCIACLTITQEPQTPETKTSVFFSVEGPAGESVPATACPFIEIWDDTSGTPVRVLQAFMFQTIAEPNHPNGSSVHSWEGTLAGPLVLDDATTYKVYFQDVIDNFAAVPEVRWEEDSAPGEDTQINPTTFPHILTRLDDGTWQFGSYSEVSTQAVRALERRTSGSDLTNPFPAFIDTPIKDVAVFQNRLCVLTKDKVSMSVTNRPEEWFRGTVTQLLATSPISIQSTAAEASRLDYFVTHNDDLIVFGPKGQFRFEGNVALTPENASLPRAATYPAEITAAPKSAGNDIFFPTTYGESSGLSQFSLDPQIDGLTVAAPLAEKQVGLLGGDIQQIEAVANTGIIYVRMAGDRDRLYVLEFEPQIDILKPLEPTWSWWQMDWGMRIISMRAGTDFLEFAAVGRAGDPDAGQVRLYRMDLNAVRKIGPLFSVPFGDIHLECRESQTGINTALTLDVNYPPHNGGEFNPPQALVVVQGPGCPNPGAAVTYTGTFPNYTLDEDMGGGEVYYGYDYLSRIWLPDIDTRDASGIIQETAKVRVNHWLVTMTGWLDAQVLNVYGQSLPVQEFRGYEPVATSQPVKYNRTSYRVQYKQEGDTGALFLDSAGHVGCDIHSIEWFGQYFKKGRRF